MFTEKHFISSVTGGELDDYLKKGWYRLGQNIFTCHFLFFEENLYSPIWTRLPLQDYRFRKSLRKIIGKIESEFEVVVREFKIDGEKERLYQKYRYNFKGKLAPTLKSSLQDDLAFNIFDSLDVSVYHGNKLIAFSVFDVGDKSLASIKGVYDHAYASYSLGLYTMLREIRFGMDHGFEYFYPGYVVPGYPRFDYKLRVGKPEDVEFYDIKTGRWYPYNTFSSQNVLVDILSSKLMELGWALSERGVSCQMLYYPAYEANMFGYENERFLESPLFLNMFNNIFPRPRFIVFYDIWKEKYVFCHCMPYEDLGFYFEYSMQFDTQSARHFLDFILKKSKIIESDDPAKVVELAFNISGLLKRPRRNDRFLK